MDKENTRVNTNKYLKVKIHMFFIGVILAAAINWGFTAFGLNLIESFHLFLNQILGLETYVDKVIYLLITVIAIIVGSKKGTWIPFLGENVFPSKAFIPSKAKDEYDISIIVKVKPSTRVAYWASLPNDNINEIPNVVSAYGDFSNSGVVVSDEKGDATLLINTSSSYKVPSGEIIKRHVHYRELDQQFGFIGEIKTIFY